MLDSKCQKCRRTGIKLFLKGERCFGPKCAMIKRPYPPGTSSIKQAKTSDFAIQLREKQKARHTYGLGERQFKNYFKQASQSGESTTDKLLEMLERRIDNIVFRAGFAPSRVAARQTISHKKFALNNKKINIPSILVEKGDNIKLVKPGKKFKIISQKSPDWIRVDKKNLSITILSIPCIKPEDLGIDMQLIVEYYNR